MTYRAAHCLILNAALQTSIFLVAFNYTDACNLRIVRLIGVIRILCVNLFLKSEPTEHGDV